MRYALVALADLLAMSRHGPCASQLQPGLRAPALPIQPTVLRAARARTPVPTPPARRADRRAVAGLRRSAVRRPRCCSACESKVAAASPMRACRVAGHRPERSGRPTSRKTEFDNTPWRFDMSQNGKRMTAEEFGAWMKARGVRVAKGGARGGCRAVSPLRWLRRPAGAPPRRRPRPPHRPPRREGTPHRHAGARRTTCAGRTADDALTDKRATSSWPSRVAPATAPRFGTRAVQARRVLAHAKPRDWIRAGRVSVDGRIVRDPGVPDCRRPPAHRRRRPFLDDAPARRVTSCSTSRAAW